METIKVRERTYWRLAAGAGLLLLGLLPAACENDSDPTAPADSTITVSANPQTVVVDPNTGAGTSTITARLRSKNGTPLPDQEVTFSTSQGTLDPPAETLLETDDNGQATSVLSTTAPATVTARSGSIMGMTSVNTVPGNVAQFVLNIGPAQELQNCGDMLTFTASVRTTSGSPVQGVQVCFLEDSTNTIAGNFSDPGEQGFTDPNGDFVAKWTPGSECDTRCTAQDPNGGVCTFLFSADDCNGNFESRKIQVFDRIQM